MSGWNGERYALTINIAAGTPRIGIWCDGCQTPARYEVDVLHLTNDGPRLLNVVNGCPRCDHDD